MVGGHSQERNPPEVLNHCIEEVAVAESVLKERIPKVSDAGKYDRTRQEDLETVQVESVDLWCQPQEEVVQNATQDRGGDTIYREEKRECERSVRTEVRYVKGVERGHNRRVNNRR
jgi:hypothetical protein